MATMRPAGVHWHRSGFNILRPFVTCRDGKMYVPSDSFGGLSPEKKASQALEALLTFTAAKIVLAQLEGSGRGALAAYNQQQYAVLSRQLQEGSLRDPDAWMAELLRQDKGIALRLMEVRAAYASTDFEWDQLQRLAITAIKDSNLTLMRKAAAASLQASTQTAAAAAPAAAEQEGLAEPPTPLLQQQQQQQDEGQQQQQQGAQAAAAAADSHAAGDASASEAAADSGSAGSAAAPAAAAAAAGGVDDEPPAGRPTGSNTPPPQQSCPPNEGSQEDHQQQQ